MAAVRQLPTAAHQSLAQCAHIALHDSIAQALNHSPPGVATMMPWTCTSAPGSNSLLERQGRRCGDAPSSRGILGIKQQLAATGKSAGQSAMCAPLLHCAPCSKQRPKVCWNVVHAAREANQRSSGLCSLVIPPGPLRAGSMSGISGLCGVMQNHSFPLQLDGQTC